jgi:hypothetical protein
MTATMQRTPTESMRASAQAHLELKDDPKHRWQWYRRDGVRYVSMVSANSGKVHQVRADSNGCDCDAYLVWQYSACSHMLAIRASLHRDALAAWVDEQERAAGLASEAECDLAFAEVGLRLRGDGAGAALILRYDEIDWGTD